MRAPVTSILAITTLLAAGCGTSGSPTAPTSSLSTAASDVSMLAEQKRVHAVPFAGDLSGTVTLTPGEGPLATVFIAASGQASHLGRFSVEIPHQVSFATATGEGTYTFTAANGDMLTAHVTGKADTSSAVFAIVEEATITGGTGRFAGATGAFTAYRLYDTVAGTTTGSFEGTISK
jgi:hypothetical protein